MKLKNGFTLVELTAAMGVAGTLALVSAQEDSFELSQQKARAMGNEVFQYNTAVSRYLAFHAGDPSVIGVSPGTPATHSGSAWLKGPGCAGSASRNYLSCDRLPNNVTIQENYRPTTQVRLNSEGALEARTVWEGDIGMGGTGDPAVMGVAALVASGNYISQAEDGASGYQLPTVHCPDMATLGSTISTICGADRNVMISMVNVNSTIEPWLRTDHGNNMHHVIEFDGTPSPQADIDAIDDGGSATGWAGAGMRQIVNVARIYNVGDGDDSLILGSVFGNGVYTDSYISSNNLLSDAVVMDGDAAVMNDLYVRMDAHINRDLDVTRDISSRRLATSEQIDAGSYVNAGTYVMAGTNVYAGNDVSATRHVQAGSNVYGKQFIDNTSGTGDYLSGNWVVNPSDDTRMNRVDLEGRLNSKDINADGAVSANRFKIKPSVPNSDFNDAYFTIDKVGQRGSELGMLIKMDGDADGSHGGGINGIHDANEDIAIELRSDLNGVDGNETTKFRLWADGAIDTKGRIKTDEYLHLNKTVTEGGACSTNGLVGRSSSGILLSCENSQWSVPGQPGMYAHFNATSCPTGWVKANGGNGTLDMRGLFVRSWADNQTRYDSGRSLGSYQRGTIATGYDDNRAGWDTAKFHGGAKVYGGDWVHVNEYSGLEWSWSDTGTTHTTYPNNRINSWANVTRPQNRALLACMKK